MHVRDVIKGSGESPRAVLYLNTGDFSRQVETWQCSAPLAAVEGSLLASQCREWLCDEGCGGAGAGIGMTRSSSAPEE